MAKELRTNDGRHQMARLRAWLALLRQKLKQEKAGKGRSSSQIANSKVVEGTVAAPAEHLDELEVSDKFDCNDPATFVDGLSKIIPARDGDRIVATIAPTFDLLRKLLAAVMNNRQIQTAETDFDEHERALVREQELVRAEGERLVAGVGPPKDRRRLDALEQRDDEIVQELELRGVEVAQMWLGRKEKIGELFGLLDDVFVRSEMLPPPASSKESETGGPGHGLHVLVNQQPPAGSNAHSDADAQTTQQDTQPSRRAGPQDAPEKTGSNGATSVRHPLATELAQVFESNQDLLKKLRQAIRDNRHMKQFEARVCELTDAEEDILASIRQEEGKCIAWSYASPANESRAKVEVLKQDHKRLRGELDRFQADAELKWALMRDWVRFILDVLDPVVVRNGGLGRDEGLQDIDHAKPMIEQFDDRRDEATGCWIESSGGGARPGSEISLRGRSCTQKPRLARKSKTHVDLRAEVQRLESELDDRVKLEHQLVANYARARRDVEEAQRQFDLKAVRHDRETIRFQARQAAGEDVGSPTEFDLKLLLDKQRLTPTLIEAEEDREAAKARAVEEGVRLGDDERSSGFVSRGSDGYGESQEVEAIEAIEREGFLEWMKKIPEGCEDESVSVLPPEIDEWEARSVGEWDSISVVAVGSERKRIDRWQKNSGQPLVDL